MKFNLVISCCIVVLASLSCGGSDSSLIEKELELRERELALKEQELALQKSDEPNEEDLSDEFVSSSNGNISPQRGQKSQEQLRTELGLKECETPVNHLKYSGTSLNGIYKNALSLKFNGFKLKFNIENTASVVTFKNIKCRVTLSSNTGSTVLVKDFTVHEFVRSGSRITYRGEFDCTNQQFNDTDQYTVQILGAECH